MRRLRVAVLSVLISVGVLAAPDVAFAGPGGRSADNVVSIENYRDRSFRARSSVAVDHARGATVANQNVASSYASCTDCRTVTAAVQIVLVEGSPTDFRPVNVAVAVNENCLRCETYAYARQIVLTPGQRVDLSDDAEGAIEDIEEDVEDVVESRQAFPDMTAQLDVLAQQMESIIKAEIARAGTSAGEDDRRDVEDDDD